MPKISLADLQARAREKNRLESEALDTDPEVQAERAERQWLLEHEIETAEPEVEDDEPNEDEEEDDDA